MALFNRNQDTVDATDTTQTQATNPNDVGPISLPESPEVTPDYYQTPLEATTATSSARRPLLIIVGVLVALLVLFGLVMGGRWVYHEFKNTGSNKTKQPTTSQQTTTPKISKPKTTTPPESSPATPAPSTATPNATTPAPTPTTTTPQTSTSPTTPSTTPSTTPATPAGSNLTNTGPGQTLAIFVIVSLLGVCAYQLRLRFNRIRG